MGTNHLHEMYLRYILVKRRLVSLRVLACPLGEDAIYLPKLLGERDGLISAVEQGDGMERNLFTLTYYTMEKSDVPANQQKCSSVKIVTGVPVNRKLTEVLLDCMTNTP